MGDNLDIGCTKLFKHQIVTEVNKSKTIQTARKSRRQYGRVHQKPMGKRHHPKIQLSVEYPIEQPFGKKNERMFNYVQIQVIKKITETMPNVDKMLDKLQGYIFKAHFHCVVELI